jgi:predicted Zn-dependent protease
MIDRWNILTPQGSEPPMPHHDSNDMPNDIVQPRAGAHSFVCGCRFHSRRLFTGALLGAGASAAWPALAREGVDVGSQSKFSKIVPADQIEAAAFQQYGQLKQEARQKNALVPDSDPQVQRLRTIAQRLIPFSYEWNPRARDWKWEINLLNAKQVNAFCMPGGKIAFYTGILEELQLTDDEVSMVMGHEIAHALREHARERMGKNVATRGAIEIGAAIFGLGNGGRMAADIGGQLLTLRFGREDESEADLVGMELTARAGYDPRAGVSLWEKMGQASKGAPPEFLSTHPSGPTRIKEIQTALPQVTPLYARAPKPSRRFSPPPKR